MTPPQPRRPVRPVRPRRSFRLRYLILGILTLPIVFGFGSLLLIILIAPHSSSSSDQPHLSSIPTISQSSPPTPEPTRRSCYPFQPNC
ncbi:hypothetical protein ACFXHA_25930 [Nocardia sp. NPDC059240]|uniref:hypothetical protein n=1 Tax=Nocardia sp. NPDC059240 TaxID=3346786 RepID=UPI0036822C2F